MTATRPLSIGSLFSGIGGLDLGLEWAGLGPVLWQVEIDPFCTHVLEKHWPNVRRFCDVRSLTGCELERVDLLCGGFPCQDVSSAGSREGLSGERSGQWREFARLAGVLRPEWIVVENVASGATLWVDFVVGDLEQLGYACLPVPVRASDLGALHERARVFVVARSGIDRAGRLSDHPKRSAEGRVVADTHQQGEFAEPVHAEVAAPPATAYVDGEPQRFQSRRRRRARGTGTAESAVARGAGPVADAHGEFGESGQGLSWQERTGRPLAPGSTPADAVRAGCEGSGTESHGGRSGSPEDPWGSPIPDILRVVHGVREWLHGGVHDLESGRSQTCPTCGSGNSLYGVRQDWSETREASHGLPKTDRRTGTLLQVSCTDRAGIRTAESEVTKEMRDLSHAILECTQQGTYLQPGVSENPRADKCAQAVGEDASRASSEGTCLTQAGPIRETDCEDPWHRKISRQGIDWGLAKPRERIKALGNSVVPQCAEVVGWIIQDLRARV